MGTTAQALEYEPSAAERVGETISRLCRERGLKKGWVAEQLGLDRLSPIVSGQRELTISEAARLAEIFGVEIETFVPARGVEA